MFRFLPFIITLLCQCVVIDLDLRGRIILVGSDDKMDLRVVLNIAVVLMSFILLMVGSVMHMIYRFTQQANQLETAMQYTIIGMIFTFTSTVHTYAYHVYDWEICFPVTTFFVWMTSVTVLQLAAALILRRGWVADMTAIERGCKKSYKKPSLGLSPLSGPTSATNIHLLFVEGTSGLGKTTICHRTLDFSEYRERHTFYNHKTTKPYLQVLYDQHIMLDCMTEVMDTLKANSSMYINSQNCVLIDRSFVSQLIYAILFFYGGQYKDPADFAETVERCVFSDRELSNLIANVTQRWFMLMDSVMAMIGSNATVGIQWFGAIDPVYTASIVKGRDGFDAHMKNLKLKNYILNQNYMFLRMHEIVGLGTYSEVYHLTERELSVKASQRVFKRNSF